VHRLSDLWGYIGARHYPGDSVRFRVVADYIVKRLALAGVVSLSTLIDAAVAPSSWTASILRELGVAKVVEIPNAVSVEPRSRSLENSGVPRLGFVSHRVDDRRKGFREMYEVLSPLICAGAIRLVVFGQTGETFRSQFGERVEFRGSFEREDLGDVFDSFDILVCPSREDNSPNVVCEALANGVPSIVQADSGMSSYVSETTGGFFDFYERRASSSGKFLDVATGIMDEYDVFRARCIDFAVSRLSLDAVGSQYLDLYRSFYLP
jgi:glycosyltransferase involved in cell wall biosynthesis